MKTKILLILALLINGMLVYQVQHVKTELSEAQDEIRYIGDEVEDMCDELDNVEIQMNIDKEAVQS